MKKIGRFGFLAFGLFCSLKLSALDVTQKFQVQELLERRITPIVKTLDSQAQVYVNLELSEEAPTSSDSAYLFNSDSLLLDEKIKFKKFQVIVVSRVEELPAQTKTLIKKLTRDINVSPQIVMEPLGSSLTEFSAPATTKVQIEGLEKAQEGFSSLGQLVFSALGLIAFVLCVVGAVVVVTFKQSTESSKSSHSSKAPSKNASPIPGGYLEGFSPEAFVAALSDCYWCQEDAYAAYVWGGIPLNQRKSVISETSFMKQYVETLNGREGKDLGYIHHPYYLAPLTVNHLDNSSLTEMVKKYPSLVFKVSPLRTKHLSLSALDRVRLELAAEGKEGERTPDFKEAPVGKQRVFSQKTPILVGSTDEESALVKLKGISLELKSRIPSLAWLLELSEPKRAQVLEMMTNEELAMAWVGPQDILEKLKKSLSVERRAELSVWLGRVRPDRTSSGFRKVHQLALEQLSAEQKRPDVTTQKKAAA